jgi:hypothetical protein
VSSGTFVKAQELRSPVAKKELAVLVACHSFLVAIPTRNVVRLFLPDEVSEVAIVEGRGGLLGTLVAGDRLCAAWDMATLLELAPLRSAWVVLDVDRGGQRASIALRTGVCALVAEIRPEASLPGRLFRTRAQAFPAAFAAQSTGTQMPALFGLWLDAARLFTDDELAASRDVIRRAREERAER